MLSVINDSSVQLEIFSPSPPPPPLQNSFGKYTGHKKRYIFTVNIQNFFSSHWSTCGQLQQIKMQNTKTNWLKMRGSR